MLMNALILATISTVCYELAYTKLPKKVQKFLVKHALFTDFITFMLTYYTLGGTLTALTAGAMVGLFTSFMLYVGQKPEDFQYLLVARDWIHSQIAQLSNRLNSWAKNVRAQQASNLVTAG